MDRRFFLLVATLTLSSALHHASGFVTHAHGAGLAHSASHHSSSESSHHETSYHESSSHESSDEETSSFHGAFQHGSSHLQSPFHGASLHGASHQQSALNGAFQHSSAQHHSSHHHHEEVSNSHESSHSMEHSGTSQFDTLAVGSGNHQLGSNNVESPAFNHGAGIRENFASNNFRSEESEESNFKFDTAETSNFQTNGRAGVLSQQFNPPSINSQNRPYTDQPFGQDSMPRENNFLSEIGTPKIPSNSPLPTDMPLKNYPNSIERPVNNIFNANPNNPMAVSQAPVSVEEPRRNKFPNQINSFGSPQQPRVTKNLAPQKPLKKPNQIDEHPSQNLFGKVPNRKVFERPNGFPNGVNKQETMTSPVNKFVKGPHHSFPASSKKLPILERPAKNAVDGPRIHKLGPPNNFSPTGITNQPVKPLGTPQNVIQRPVTPLGTPQNVIQRPVKPLGTPQNVIQRPAKPLGTPKKVIQRPETPLSKFNEPLTNRRIKTSLNVPEKINPLPNSSTISKTAEVPAINNANQFSKISSDTPKPIGVQINAGLHGSLPKGNYVSNSEMQNAFQRNNIQTDKIGTATVTRNDNYHKPALNFPLNTNVQGDTKRPQMLVNVPETKTTENPKSNKLPPRMIDIPSNPKQTFPANFQQSKIPNNFPKDSIQSSNIPAPKKVGLEAHFSAETSPISKPSPSQSLQDKSTLPKAYENAPVMTNVAPKQPSLPYLPKFNDNNLIVPKINSVNIVPQSSNSVPNPVKLLDEPKSVTVSSPKNAIVKNEFIPGSSLGDKEKKALPLIKPVPNVGPSPENILLPSAIKEPIKKNSTVSKSDFTPISVIETLESPKKVIITTPKIIDTPTIKEKMLPAIGTPESNITQSTSPLNTTISKKLSEKEIPVLNGTNIKASLPSVVLPKLNETVLKGPEKISVLQPVSNSTKSISNTEKLKTASIPSLASMLEELPKASPNVTVSPSTKTNISVSTFPSSKTKKEVDLKVEDDYDDDDDDYDDDDYDETDNVPSTKTKISVGHGVSVGGLTSGNKTVNISEVQSQETSGKSGISVAQVAPTFAGPRYYPAVSEPPAVAVLSPFAAIIPSFVTVLTVPYIAGTVPGYWQPKIYRSPGLVPVGSNRPAGTFVRKINGGVQSVKAISASGFNRRHTSSTNSFSVANSVALMNKNIRCAPGVIPAGAYGPRVSVLSKSSAGATSASTISSKKLFSAKQSSAAINNAGSITSGLKTATSGAAKAATVSSATGYIHKTDQSAVASSKQRIIAASSGTSIKENCRTVGFDQVPVQQPLFILQPIYQVVPYYVNNLMKYFYSY